MIHEAIETGEAIVWGAVISVGILAACTAWLVVAIGYWTGVAALWARDAICQRRARKEKP